MSNVFHALNSACQKRSMHLTVHVKVLYHKTINLVHTNYLF